MKHTASRDIVSLITAKALEIRIDSLRETTAAASGHPTSCLSIADIIASFFFHILRYDYANPHNINNDRFILSKGHAVPVVYAALHRLGIISEQDLMSYRDINSVLEGHPTPRFPYNEAATGSLGQGLSIGLGMALNARHEGLSYRTYVLMGDAEIAEGSVWEAAALAAHYGVDNLIGIVDCNRLGQSGPGMHDHDVMRYADKWRAFGWKVFVINGHNIREILDVFDQACSIKGQPVMVIAKTMKGYGLEGVEDHQGFHGKPFKHDELPEIITKLRDRFGDGAINESTESQLPESVRKASLLGLKNIELDLAKEVNSKEFAIGARISTRKAFGYALVALGAVSDRVFVLDADVKNSTYTEFFEKQFPERFIQCFVAEQNMVGVAAGLALRGKIPFASTFACFFARAYDQIRMAGIGRVSLRLCGSHSGVSIGQDGPSQMGLEDIAMMRAIPGSVVLWPSDGVSAYKLVEQMALYNDGVSYLKSTRADFPILYEKNEAFPIGGCKVLRSSDCDQACIITAGVTVHEALEAYALLRMRGINVAIIDLYSIKPMDEKTIAQVARNSRNNLVTVEDHYAQGGLGEAVVSALRNEEVRIRSCAVTKLPRSGSPEALMAYEEIDALSIVNAVISMLE